MRERNGNLPGPGPSSRCEKNGRVRKSTLQTCSKSSFKAQESSPGKGFRPNSEARVFPRQVLRCVQSTTGPPLAEVGGSPAESRVTSSGALPAHCREKEERLGIESSSHTSHIISASNRRSPSEMSAESEGRRLPGHGRGLHALPWGATELATLAMSPSHRPASRRKVGGWPFFLFPPVSHTQPTFHSVPPCALPRRPVCRRKVVGWPFLFAPAFLPSCGRPRVPPSGVGRPEPRPASGDRAAGPRGRPRPWPVCPDGTESGGPSPAGLKTWEGASPSSCRGTGPVALWTEE